MQATPSKLRSQEKSLASKRRGSSASRRTKRRAEYRELERRRKHDARPLDSECITIEAPTNLSFDTSDAAERTRAFFDNIRFRRSQDGIARKRLVVELSSVRYMSLGAALMLVAEFDRWQRVLRMRLIAETLATWDRKIVEQLVSLGFFKLLGTHVPPPLKHSENPEWIPFVSGTETVGRAAKLLRVRLETLLHRQSGVGSDIYIALVECMKNTFQHAYPDNGFPDAIHPAVGRRWWMAGSVDVASQIIRVAFLDIGISIPKSLPFSWMWPYLQARSRTGGDEVLIAEALQYGRSRLAQHHRGKGFRNIRHATTLHPANKVTVVSGWGICIDINGKVLAVGAKTPVHGTLVQWEFHLRARQKISALVLLF